MQNNSEQDIGALLFVYAGIIDHIKDILVKNKLFGTSLIVYHQLVFLLGAQRKLANFNKRELCIRLEQVSEIINKIISLQEVQNLDNFQEIYEDLQNICSSTLYSINNMATIEDFEVNRF